MSLLAQLRLRPGERSLVALFVATLPFVNPYVRGDGNGYYAYLRSAVIDRDLHFENEYHRGDPDFLGVVFRYADGHLREYMTMPNGRVRNQWSIGPSLLWAPFFLQAHFGLLVLRELGVEVVRDGYSWPYRASCAFGTALYGFAGLLLAHRAALRFAVPSSALLAVLGIWFASSLPVYMYALPFHVHATASFAVALFVWYWLRTRAARSPRQWAVLGLLGGLMLDVYLVNGAVLVLAALDWLATALSSRNWRHALATGAAFASAAAVAFAPHLAVKWIVHGSPFVTGLLTSIFWSAPRLFDVAFSSHHGALVWTPVLGLALAGLVAMVRSQRPVATALLLTGAAFYYVIASYEIWHGDSAFGSRFLVSLSAIFVIGLAVALDTLGSLVARATTRHRATAALATALALLALWNAGFVFQWASGMVPREGPVSLRAVARNQVVEVPRRSARTLLRYLVSRDAVVREAETARP